MMKKAAIGIATIAALMGTPAAAADVAPPPPPVPAYSWAGLYGGGNLGLALNASQDTVEPTGCFLTPVPACDMAINPLRTFSNNRSNGAFTGGGQFGFNWQVNSIVVGLEADINYSGLNQNLAASPALAAPLSGNLAYSVSERPDWFGTVRGRLGFAPLPAVLVYATGGFAYGGVSSSSAAAFPATGDTYAGSASSIRPGWTAGAGAEWSISPEWSVKGEYLYVDLGSFSYTDNCLTNCAVPGYPSSTPLYQTDLSVREHIFRVGLNYHFKWGETPPWLGAY